VLAILCAILELAFLPETNKQPLSETPPKKRKKEKKDHDFHFGSAPLWPIPLGSAVSLRQNESEARENQQRTTQL
jgi:hypothetical protein